MTVEWLEHVELPDGQAVDLLKRYPYERATQIEIALEHDRTLTQSLLPDKASVVGSTWTGFSDAVLRASLWAAKPDECEKPHLLKHGLTGAQIPASQIGMAADPIVKGLREKAMVNYVEWYDDAYPGPKDSLTAENMPANQTPPSEIPESSDQMTPEPTPSEIAA